MDIPLLISGLRESPSFSDPVRHIYNANLAIPKVNTLEDINALLDISSDIINKLVSISFSNVDTKVMSIHARVLKPFINNTDIEDDFI